MDCKAITMAASIGVVWDGRPRSTALWIVAYPRQRGRLIGCVLVTEVTIAGFWSRWWHFSPWHNRCVVQIRYSLYINAGLFGFGAWPWSLHCCCHGGDSGRLTGTHSGCSISCLGLRSFEIRRNSWLFFTWL